MKETILISIELATTIEEIEDTNSEAMLAYAERKIDFDTWHYVGLTARAKKNEILVQQLLNNLN